MFKNGLFIISMGLIAFIYSANPITGVYQWANLLLAFFLIALGTGVAIKGHRKNQEKEGKEHGNR
ncbi:hypothetical protein ACYSNO_02615 [Enterococcus sp. LJL98]